MEMKFLEGDRVHVTRLDGEKVDFYATLSCFDSYLKTADLVNCTDKSHEEKGVYLPIYEEFGTDKDDYYTLATDEEDTEEPVIQRVENINEAIEESEKYIEQAKHDHKIELENHYIIEVKKGLYVKMVNSDYLFKFTKDVNEAKIYEHKQSIKRHEELVDGRILNLKRYVDME